MKKFKQKTIQIMLGMLLLIAAGTMGVSAKAEDTAVVVEKDYPNVSCDADHPAGYVMGTEARGPLYRQNGGFAKQYYTFTLAEAATVTGTYTAEDGWMEIEQGTGYRQRIFPGDAISIKMAAGTYSICVRGATSNAQKYAGKEYVFCLNAANYNWGNVQVNWNVENLTAPCDIPFEVTLSGTTETKLDQTSAMTWSGTIHQDKPGYYTFEVPLNADSLGKKTLEYSYVVKPQKENLLKSRIQTTKNAICIANTTNYNNTLVKIQILENGNWVTKNTTFDSKSGVTRLSGLKADSKYTIRLVNCYNDGVNPAVYSDPSKQITVYTASNKKPAVKSIKVYGFKKFYVKKKWYPGYWNTLNKWVSGQYQGGYYGMSYKIKVTLKDNLRRKGIKYIYINGVKCKVKKNGKTYVATASYRGTAKKKKVFVYVCTAKDATYGGLSPSTKKFVKTK